MARTRTLRGKLAVTANSVGSSELVFSYESPDRTRGWIVDGAFAWIANPLEPGLGASAQANLMGCLTTDLDYSPRANAMIDPSDNRGIGWLQRQYNSRNYASGEDYVTPNAGDLTTCKFLLDQDRIVTNDLKILLAFNNEDASLNYEVGWMVVLREVSISPSQSLMQQLKGIGQDITN